MWIRAWGPQHHSLFLAGWIESRQELADATPNPFGAQGGTFGPSFAVKPQSELQRYTSDFGLFTADAHNHGSSLEQTRHTLGGGARWQMGAFEVENQQELQPSGWTLSSQHVRPDFDRLQLYAYDTWQVLEPLYLTAGISYDEIKYPINHRDAPFSDDEDRKSQLSPKVGAVWEVTRRTWFRAAYTRSLGGVSFDRELPARTDTGGRV